MAPSSSSSSPRKRRSDSPGPQAKRSKHDADAADADDDDDHVGDKENEENPSLASPERPLLRDGDGDDDDNEEEEGQAVAVASVSDEPVEEEEEEEEPSNHGDDEEEEEACKAVEDDDAAAAEAEEDDNAAVDEEEEEAMEEEAAVEEEEEAAVEEEAEDTTAAQARGRPSNSRNLAGRPAEAGIIKEIYVENFMCHRKLRVKLNRNVNFIHGQNGSGKSAVLAAIQICLGANARRTNRARNMKDLVRKDAASGAVPSQARIRVTILNQGSDGYRREEYGDTITIEKTISLVGGNSGFKLRDQNDKVVSTSKNDLYEMLDTLNIQVENPVAVLDQDEAKKFLMGKAEDKYAFFMKATELERVDNTYAETCDKVEALSSMNNNSRNMLEGNMAQLKELKRKWQEHQKMGELELQLQKQSVEYGWAIYNDDNDKYQGAVEKQKKFEEKAKKTLDALTQAEASFNSPEEEEQSNREKIDSLLKEAQEQMDLKTELETQLKTEHTPLKQLEREIKQFKKQQKFAEKELDAAKRRLQQARDQIIANADSAESEEARRTALLKKMEEELAEARGNVDSLKQEISKYYRAYEELEPSVHEAKSKIDGLKSQLSGVQNTMRSLSSSKGDSLAILGSRVSKVVQLIEQAKRSNKFQGPVIGPIFSHLKIAPGMESFASVAEIALGPNVLDRFIVTNDRDNKVLRRIRQQAGCFQDCNIFQVHPNSTKDRFNIPSPPAIDGIETVASVLLIDNVTVFNCLVDNAKIEKKAIARDRPLSEQHLLVRNGNRPAIRGNFNEVYFLPKGDHWTVRNGSTANFSNDKQLRNTIGVDKTAAIEEARRDEAQIKEELKVKKAEEAKLTHEHTHLQREWNKAKKAVQANDNHISTLTDKIEAIKDEMEASANVTIDTSEYEEEVMQAEEAIEKIRESQQKLVAQRDEIVPRIEEIRSRLDETTMRNQKVRDEIKAAESQLTQFLESQTQQQSEIAKKREKLEKYQKIVDEHEKIIETLSAERESSLKKARKLHFRYQQRVDAKNKASEGDETSEEPPEEISQEASPEDLEAIEPREVKHEPEYYEARIKNTKAKIEKERARRNVSNEDPAVAYEKYQTAKTAYTKQAEAVEATEKTIEELKIDVKRRQKRWQQFRSHLSRTTGLKFNEMLQLNKYTGSLEFMHDSQSLDLAVAKSSQGETKDVKALSGGERSYTTMCLLLALGETLETPFRILDEFDVFLDAEVRKLTIQSLIHVAKKMKHRQFIFITPQDLSSVQTDPEVNIFKMRNPFRHQVAGGPSQQTLNFSQASQD